MYVKDIVFYNRAPFNNLHLTLEEDSISVLTAVNGKGKTTILSYIMDAWVEITKRAYPQTYKDKIDDYYRVSAGIHLIDASAPSFVYIRFMHDDNPYDYLDYRNGLPEDIYEENVKFVDKIEYSDIKNEVEHKPSAKIVDSRLKNELIKQIFDSHVMTYMPSYRSEIPNYLNDAYKTKWEHDMSMKYSGYLQNPLEVSEGMHQFANWLLDLLLDYALYDKEKSGPGPIPEDFVWENVNVILRKALISKHPDEDIRFGAERRGSGAERISIFRKSDDRKLYPSIFSLSTGEQSMLMMFCEIIRQADRIQNNIALEDIAGVVLIDEIDKHLHLKLQKEELPILMCLFPKVQFIVTSHSPFLNMGLAEKALERAHIIDLDNGGVVSTPTNNEVYQDTYEMFLGERNRYAEMLAKVQPKIESLTKPLVITEGKSDWKHFKKALEFFKSNGEFTELDFELLEYDDDLGDSRLGNALVHYSFFPNRFKIIGIFDCDDGDGKGKGNGIGIHRSGGIKEYENGVYGMSIPVPDYRLYNDWGISVEFLYTDEDLKKVKDNRRLYVTSEFNDIGRLKTDYKIGVLNADKNRRYLNASKEKILDYGVYDNDGNSLALSKESFAVSVLYGIEPFDNMDFKGFRAVFERLSEIIMR